MLEVNDLPVCTLEKAQKIKETLERIDGIKYEIVPYLPSLKSGLYYIRKRRKVKHKGDVE